MTIDQLPVEFPSLIRELRRIAARPRYLVWTTLGVVFSYLFFLTMMREGQPEDLPIAVVDCDGSYLSRRLCHEIDATQGVRVVAVYNNHHQARTAMQRQQIYAFLEIPEGTYADVLDFKAPHMALYANNSYLLAGSLSYKTLATIGKLSAAAVQREVLRKKGMDEERIMGLIQPVELDTHLISNPMANYQPYVLTTILPGIVALMAMLLTVYEIGRERKERTLKEWLHTGRTSLASVLGKLLPYTFWFSLLVVAGNIIFFGPGGFVILGNFWWLVLAAVLLIFAAQSMGVFISAMIPQQHLSVCIGAIYGALSFSMSGFSYPADAMPAPLQALAYIFPLRHYYLTYSDVAMFGTGFGHVWPHFAALLLMLVPGILGALLIVRQQTQELTEPPELTEFPESLEYLDTPELQANRETSATTSLLRHFAGFLKDVWDVFTIELRSIFTDGGVLLIFFIATLLYPFIFAAIYKNEQVRNVPVAVVDQSCSSESRRFAHKFDATPEVEVAYRCSSMAEAEQLMKDRKIHGILFFPMDYGTRMAELKTARACLFCDMSSFLYYRSVYSGASAVLIDEMHEVQLIRYSKTGITGEQASDLVTPIGYDDVKLYSPAGGFTSFLVPALLVLVLHQTMFLGISILFGTKREDREMVKRIPRHLRYRHIHRVTIGRALAYLMIYIPLCAVDLVLMPRWFGLPHIGSVNNLILFTLPFLLATTFFCMTVAAFVRERDTGVVTCIFFSVVLIFLSGAIWPQCNMPQFWHAFSYLFPSTPAIQGFIGINSMGANLNAVKPYYMMLWVQTGAYFLTTCASLRIAVRLSKKRGITE